MDPRTALEDTFFVTGGTRWQGYQLVKVWVHDYLVNHLALRLGVQRFIFSFMFLLFLILVPIDKEEGALIADALLPSDSFLSHLNFAADLVLQSFILLFRWVICLGVLGSDYIGYFHFLFFECGSLLLSPYSFGLVLGVSPPVTRIVRSQFSRSLVSGCLLFGDVGSSDLILTLNIWLISLVGEFWNNFKFSSWHFLPSLGSRLFVLKGLGIGTFGWVEEQVLQMRIHSLNFIWRHFIFFLSGAFGILDFSKFSQIQTLVSKLPVHR